MLFCELHILRQVHILWIGPNPNIKGGKKKNSWTWTGLPNQNYYEYHEFYAGLRTEPVEIRENTSGCDNAKKR